MADVFVSYSHADKKFAEALAVALEAEGLTIWRDARALKPADDFTQLIKNAIRASSSVIVIWSGTSRKSEWVGREASIADYAGKLIQVCIDDDQPPNMYGGRHAAKFPDGSTPVDRDGREFRSLCSVVKQRRTAAMMRKVLGIGIWFLAVSLAGAGYIALSERVSSIERTSIDLKAGLYTQPTKVCRYEQPGTKTYYWPVPINSEKPVCEQIIAQLSEGRSGKDGPGVIYYWCLIDDDLKDDPRCGANWGGSYKLPPA